ncbi:MAG: cobyrinic acid a,c-diamide synthase, partial [Pseudomonadota bacterium]
NVSPWIAVNMADTRVAGRRTYEALARASQTFLGFRPPLAGIILRDAKVREAIRNQKTLPHLNPQSQAAIDAGQIAEAVLRGGLDAAAEG